MQKSNNNANFLQEIVNAIPIGVLLVDSGQKITFANRKIENLLKYDEQEIAGINFHDLIPERFIKNHRILSDQYMLNPTPRPMDSGRILPIVQKNGKEIMVQIGLTPMSIGSDVYIMVALIEVRNKILNIASFNDPLTGLPNRTLFDELSNNLNTLAIRNTTSLALMYLDVDNFKDVNDQYGHDLGDLVLCKTTSLFKEVVRKNDIVGRIGGDEFVICMYGVEDYVHLQDIAHKLIKVVDSIKYINGQQIDIGISVGGIFVELPTEIVIDELVKSADKLMYKAKKAGKGMVFLEKW